MELRSWKKFQPRFCLLIISEPGLHGKETVHLFQAVEELKDKFQGIYAG